jgi:serine/threonine protein kinase
LTNDDLPTLPGRAEADPRGQEQDATAASEEIVDNYRLLRKLGEGGMGEVWEAEQLRPINRIVALKLIKAGMDTAEVMARFESERQTLAMMEHANIAKVLDAGTTKNLRPYFVMEYVPGEPLIKYCDDHRLDTEARLRLFMALCDGVQHAHQKAIIHRDLKPSNVLVIEQDGKPLPKIIDFGLARAVTRDRSDITLLTEAGTLLGTLEYMSPEQVEMSGMDVDTRADVYALGVILYELLVGELPFDSREHRDTTFDEIRRIIREDDPPKPSRKVTTIAATRQEVALQRRGDPGSLAKKLRGELDWITMKALEKDRDRRYPTARELGADVERYLNLQPVEAGPPSRTYRFRKFVRRHRVGVFAGTAVALALLAGMTAATWGLFRALRAEDKAEQEAAQSEAVNDFLQDMLSSVSPEQAQGREVTVREVLDEASERMGGSSLAEQPEVEAAVRNTIGSTYRALGLYDAAEPHLRAALETRRRLFGPNSEKVGESLHSLGNLLWDESDYAGAEDLIRQALAVDRSSLGPENERVLSCLNDLAVVLQSRGDYDGAEASFREALALARRLPGDHRRNIAEYSSNLSWVLQSKGEQEEAEKLSREALDLNRELFGGEHPNVLVGQVNLAALLKHRQKYAEAESLYLESLEPMRKVFGAEHPTTLRGQMALGELYLTRGQTDRAEPLLADALEKAEKTLGPDHTLAITLLADMGWVHRARGDMAGAEPFYREVRARRIRTLGPEHPFTIRADWQVARVLVDQGRYAEAAKLAGETLPVARRVLPEGNENLSSTLLYCGLALIGSGAHAEAEPILRECLQSLEATQPEGAWQVAEAKSALGAALAGLGRFSEAETMLLEGYQGLRSDPVTPSLTLHRSVGWLADLYKAWDAADPSAGKRTDVARWRDELASLDAGS